MISGDSAPIPVFGRFHENITSQSTNQTEVFLMWYSISCRVKFLQRAESNLNSSRCKREPDGLFLCKRVTSSGCWSAQLIAMTTTMMRRRPWGAGLQPGPAIWSPWSPSPAVVAGCPGRWGGSGSGAARPPGSGSTSTPSAGPSAGPAARRWLTWRRGTTPSWPRPPGCPRWCVTRRAPPGAKGQCE